jgi:hypothetical protein
MSADISSTLFGIRELLVLFIFFYLLFFAFLSLFLSPSQLLLFFLSLFYVFPVSHFLSLFSKFPFYFLFCFSVSYLSLFLPSFVLLLSLFRFAYSNIFNLLCLSRSFVQFRSFSLGRLSLLLYFTISTATLKGQQYELVIWLNLTHLVEKERIYNFFMLDYY